MFKTITPVAVEPVTVEEAKVHLRVDHSDEDALIGALITAAREYGEHYTGRAFAPQTLEMGLCEFPSGAITLDLPPVTTVESIKYTDTDGVEQTLSADDYDLSTYGLSREVSLAYGSTWPATQDVADAVRVRYVTGYTTLPSAAQAAMLLIIGHLYENRQDVAGVNLQQIPMGARALLDTVKVWSI